LQIPLKKPEIPAFSTLFLKIFSPAPCGKCLKPPFTFLAEIFSLCYPAFIRCPPFRAEFLLFSVQPQKGCIHEIQKIPLFFPI
jgi:hypothetical protein